MIGTRLGPYEITAKLGEGGMGVVFKARDFHLGREVALKVLPEGFTQDPERLARFEREAKLLAQLNHPNIAQIHGLEVQGNTRALVMEFVEGPTLAERLERGSLPLDESLSIARQIAEALEEAHEKGIIHRDLKPQTIKASTEGKVKVLDFGLAKAMDPLGPPSGAPSASQLAASPTLTLGATVQGVILGTAAYMSPEQAKGLAVDKRADIWAFGVVLYEMLSGRRLFDGETVPETLADVLRAEIDLGALPGDTPPALHRLLARCLERNPRNRLRDIGEARVALLRAAEAPAETSAGEAAPQRARWLERTAFALGALLLAGGAWTLAGRGEAPTERLPIRSHLLPPEGSDFSVNDAPVTISPDGSSIVFRLDSPDGTSELAVQRLDSFEVRRLPGTTGAYEPFWSADGRSIGFFSTHLARIDASGLQPAQTLAPVRDGRGGSWNRRGVVLFAPDPAGVLHRVDAAGGEPVAVTRLDPERREAAHLRPSFLPDGERFLYLVRSEAPESSGVFVGSLDGKLKKRVLALDTAARFAAPGYLLVVQEGRLIARRFDLERLAVVGDPVALAENVEYIVQYDSLPVSASEQGRLVYYPVSAGELRQVWRIDRAGQRLATIGEPGDSNLDLSPDGRRLAVVHLDPATRRPFLWIHDLERDVRFRVDTGASANGPVWSPDGRRLAYVKVASTEPELVIRPADGGAERVVWRSPFLVEPVDWSPDGRLLLVEAGAAGERVNLLLVPADGSGSPQPFATTRAAEHSGRFSPDGRFIAYVSDESGRSEIYVEPLQRTGAKWIASRRGGTSPRWSGDGRELLYVEPGARAGGEALMSVAVSARAGELAFGVLSPLGAIPSADFEPMPGGRELLVGAPVSAAVTRTPVLIENWTALVKSP